MILFLTILLSLLHLGLVDTLKKKQQKNPKKNHATVQISVFYAAKDLWFQGIYVTGPGFAV